MAAQVQPLRPFPAGSPERDRLAAAIERHREQTTILARYRAAATKAREATIEAIWAVGTAEAVLAEAQSDAPHNYVTALLGEPSATSATTVDAAARALEAVRAQSGFARDGEEALKKEIVAIEYRDESARAARDEALREVVRTSPGVARLWDDYQAANRRVASLAEALRFLGPLRLPKRADSWQALREWPADPSIAAAWREALALLEANPSSPLPGDDDPPAAA